MFEISSRDLKSSIAKRASISPSATLIDKRSKNIYEKSIYKNPKLIDQFELIALEKLFDDLKPQICFHFDGIYQPIYHLRVLDYSIIMNNNGNVNALFSSL